MQESPGGSGLNDKSNVTGEMLQANVYMGYIECGVYMCNVEQRYKRLKGPHFKAQGTSGDSGFIEMSEIRQKSRMCVTPIRGSPS